MMRSYFFLLIGIFLWSCNAVSPELRKDKEVILVRKIGHEIMRYTGDSTTSISPIKELATGSYQLDFDVPFSFISDTIINIIDKEIRNVTQVEYLVKVNSCSLKELVFSYYISPLKNDDLVSCRGRNQEEDCYNIQLTFLEKKGIPRWIPGFITVCIFLLVLLVFLFNRNNKNRESRKNGKQTVKNVLETVNIGRFEFNYEEQYLEFRADRISLTYKEAKILRILNESKSDVVTRETLLKEVWEDEGVMVSRSLDMFISKLRKKLKEDSNVQIINIHGIGYKLIAT